MYMYIYIYVYIYKYVYIYIYQLSLLSTSLQVGRVARLLFLVEDLIAYNNVRFTTSAEIGFYEFRMRNFKDTCM